MTIRVDTPEAAQAVIAGVMHQLEDWTTFFDLMNEEILPEAQMQVWDSRFRIGLQHAQSTIEARAKGRGYYRNPPNERARPDFPYLEWTGALRHATDHFTKIGPKSATIDPSQNYDGPIKAADPFSVIANGLPESAIWFLDSLDQSIEKAIESWLGNQIIAKVAA